MKKYLVKLLCLRIQLLFFKNIHFMCIEFRLSMYHVHVWGLKRPKECIGLPETGVMEECEHPCGCEERTQVLWKSLQYS